MRIQILSRRNGLYAALIFAAASTATITAITTTAIATGATVTIPATATPEPSARMADLVASYRQALTAIDSIAPSADVDPAVWEKTEAAFFAAQAALMAERPATVADYALKFDALLEVENGDGEFAAVKKLSEDAHALSDALSGGAK